MNLDYNEEYKSFEKEVQDFCKQYKDISFSDGAKIPFSAKVEVTKIQLKDLIGRKSLLKRVTLLDLFQKNMVVMVVRLIF